MHIFMAFIIPSHLTLSWAISSVSDWGDSAETISSWAWSSATVFWAWNQTIYKRYPLGIYVQHYSVQINGAQITAATCSNSSESCCICATSPRSFSVVWLNSFWTWEQTHTDDWWLVQIYRDIHMTKQQYGSNTHKQKLLHLCSDWIFE